MRPFLFLALTVVLLLSSSPLVAQTRAVGAPSSDTTASHTYHDPNEAVVTAIRNVVRKSSVPFDITSTDLPNGGSDRSIAPLLRVLPGLQISDRFNFAVGERITNRGFGARTQFGVRGIRIVQDGIPLTFADGQSALESVDPQDVSSIELLNGPGSALYGNAAGGVLLLHTFHTDPWLRFRGRTQVSASGGSDGLFQYAASSDGALSQNVMLGASYNHLAYTGFRDHSAAQVLRAAVRGKIDLNAPSSASAGDAADVLTIDGRYTEFHALNPGALTQAELDTNIHIAAQSSIKADARKDGHQSQIGASWKHGSDSSQLGISAYAIGRSLTNPIVGKITDLSRIAGGGQVVYSATPVSTLQLRWNLGAAVDAMNDDRTSFVNTLGHKGAVTLDQNERVTASAAFGAISLAPMADVTAMLAARYDRVHFGVTDHFITSSDPDDSGDRTMDAFSPSLGVIWRAAKELQVFANVSTSFETPTTTELSNQPTGAGGFNPDLAPQHATEFEAGLRGRVTWWLSYGVTGYVTNIRGELIPYELPDAPGRSYYRNAGSARHKGIETSILAFPIDSLDLRASFTYIDARYTDYVVGGVDYALKRVPGVAPTLVNLSATYHLPLGFNGSIGLTSTGGTYANDANSVSATSHNVVDVTVGTDGVALPAIDARLIVSAGVENALNTKYVSSVVVNAAANRYFEPGSGRAFWAALSIRFGLPVHAM